MAESEVVALWAEIYREPSQPAPLPPDIARMTTGRRSTNGGGVADEAVERESSARRRREGCGPFRAPRASGAQAPGADGETKGSTMTKNTSDLEGELERAAAALAALRGQVEAAGAQVRELGASGATPRRARSRPSGGGSRTRASWSRLGWKGCGPGWPSGRRPSGRRPTPSARSGWSTSGSRSWPRPRRSTPRWPSWPSCSRRATSCSP